MAHPLSLGFVINDDQLGVQHPTDGPGAGPGGLLRVVRHEPGGEEEECREEALCLVTCSRMLTG